MRASCHSFRFRSLAPLLCGCAVAACCLPAVAQPPGRRGGPGEPGRGGREATLRQMDANGDGLLQRDEVPERARSFLERAAERVGVAAGEPIPIDRLLAAGPPDRRNDERKKERRDWPAAATARSSESDDKVPGFGVDEEPPAVPGFGAEGPLAGVPVDELYDRRVLDRTREIMRRYDSNRNGLLDAQEWEGVPWGSDPHESDTNGDGRLSRDEMTHRIAKRMGVELRAPGSGPRRSASSGSRGSSEENEKIRRYAEGLLNRYDRNKSGVLEKEEWSQMRGSTRDSDANGDGVITRRELEVKLGSYGKSGASSSTGAGSAKFSAGKSKGDKSKGGSDDKSKRAGHRFLTPHERLPKGLPGWFAERDKNADGQVAMSEFSSSWSESKAKEFDAHDTNGDGVITPAEALATGKK